MSSNKPECDCIAQFNADLAKQGYNAAIVTNLFGPARATIDTYKPDEKKRGKPPIIIASHCPFCGVRYLSTEERAAQVKAVA